MSKLLRLHEWMGQSGMSLDLVLDFHRDAKLRMAYKGVRVLESAEASERDEATNIIVGWTRARFALSSNETWLDSTADASMRSPATSVMDTGSKGTLRRFMDDHRKENGLPLPHEKFYQRQLRSLTLPTAYYNGI